MEICFELIKRRSGMIYILAVFSILEVVFFAVCAVKESKTTGLYKALNVYGRIRAYLFADFLIYVIGAIAFIPVGLLIPDFSVPVIRYLLIGAAGLAAAFLIYRNTKKNCPVQLRGSLARDMIISGCGVGMKMALFFIPVLWKLSMPNFTDAYDEQGRHVFIADNGTGYSANGDNVGTMVEDNKYIPY